jgi:hypothetical protein
MFTLEGSAKASCGYITEPIEVRHPPEPAPAPTVPGGSLNAMTSDVSCFVFSVGDIGGHVSPPDEAKEAANQLVDSADQTEGVLGC